MCCQNVVTLHLFREDHHINSDIQWCKVTIHSITVLKYNFKKLVVYLFQCYATYCFYSDTLSFSRSSSVFIVHCEVGGWTNWGPCIRRSSARPYRRGQETRDRQVLKSPSVSGDPCPPVSQMRKCVNRKRPNSPSGLYKVVKEPPYRLCVDMAEVFNFSKCRDVFI